MLQYPGAEDNARLECALKCSGNLKKDTITIQGGGREGEGVATIYAPQGKLLCALRAYNFPRPFFLM